jgi:hypothetical protein
MKRLLIYCVILLLSFGGLQAAERKLWDKLMDVTIEHIREQGPDGETAHFMTMSTEYSWERRHEVVRLTTPYLDVTDPDKVASAIVIFYRYRGKQISGRRNFQLPENLGFFSGLDKEIYSRIDRFNSLKNDHVLKELSLYLGTSGALSTNLLPRATQELWNIVRNPVVRGAKEQALILLCSPYIPASRDELVPYLLEDPVGYSLPYHYRDSYGKASIPYLRRAQAEAKFEKTRINAATELKILETTATRVPGP